MIEAVLGSVTVTDWTQIAVAAGTFLLALFTAYMAWKTKALADEAGEEAKAVRLQSDAVSKQAIASELQAATSSKALEASIKPWMTRGGPTVSVKASPQALEISFDLSNVGAGLGIIQAVREYRDQFTVEGRDPSGQPVTRFCFADTPALRPGASTAVWAVVQSVEVKSFLGQDQGDGLFWVNVPYTDAFGGQLVHARIRITYSKGASEWLFHQIAYRAAEDADPFVTVEFEAAVRSRRPTPHVW